MRLGLAGIGLMGKPIARRLLEAGHELSVWSRTPQHSIALAAYGAYYCNTLEELAERSPIILLCLADEAAVLAVTLAEQGLKPSLRAEHLIVDLSTISPGTTRQLAQTLQAHCGSQWVDCPMSGGVTGAEQGRLILLAGGTEAAVARLHPWIGAFSQRLTHLGPVGSGQMTKLCNQLIVAANSLLIAEAVTLAGHAGVDAGKLAAALTGGFADSLPLQILAPRMASHCHEPLQWRVATLHKDLHYALQTAHDLHLSLPVAEKALQQLATALKSWSNDDLSRIIDLYPDFLPPDVH